MSSAAASAASPVREHLCGRRLVGDEDADLRGMAGDEGKGVHGATAARREIHRSGVQRRDQPVQVVGVLIRR